MMTAANTMDQKERNSHLATRGRSTRVWGSTLRVQDGETDADDIDLQYMDHLHQRQCGFDAGERAEDTGAGCAEGMWTAITRVAAVAQMAAVTPERRSELDVVVTTQVD